MDTNNGKQGQELDLSYYEEGGDSDADAFAIVALIVIFTAMVAWFLQA